MPGGPGAVGPPGLGDFGERVAGPVLSGDLGVQLGFVPGQAIRCICAAQHNQPGGERPQSLNLLHALDGLIGIERPQRRAIEQPVQGSLSDRPEILALAAGKTQVEPEKGARRGERAVATGHDKLAVRYEATVHIAAISEWLRPGFLDTP